MKQKVSKKKIKDYWETKSPQTWYSDKKYGSLEWFNELEYKRYNVYYKYFKEFSEFKHHSGERVLEIGVGMGTDTVQFAKNGAKVYGIDLTEHSIEMTKKNFKLHLLPLYPLGRLKVADAENLPYPNNSFDLVYSIGTIHHTPDTQKAIKEIHRVLKPEGKAIVLIYARGWKHYFKRIFIHGILFGKLRHGYSNLINKQTEVHGNSPLTYVYKKKEVKKMFGCFGEVEMRRYRLGEYFDYAPYKTKKLPQFIVNLCYLFALDRVFGESRVIKAIKTKKKRSSFWKTLVKP